MSRDAVLLGLISQHHQKYWKECVNLANIASSKLKIFHHGAIPFQKVLGVLSKNDLFLFPTKGENFGHVICEALFAGLPVITSDQTPPYWC